MPYPLSVIIYKSIFVNRIQLSCPPGTNTPVKWGNWIGHEEILILKNDKHGIYNYVIFIVYSYSIVLYIYTQIYTNMRLSKLFVDFLQGKPETSREKTDSGEHFPTAKDRFHGTSWPHRWRKRHPPREERRAWTTGVSAQNDEKMTKDDSNWLTGWWFET